MSASNDMKILTNKKRMGALAKHVMLAHNEYVTKLTRLIKEAVSDEYPHMDDDWAQEIISGAMPMGEVSHDECVEALTCEIKHSCDQVEAQGLLDQKDELTEKLNALDPVKRKQS